jgi:hypothetical protein
MATTPASNNKPGRNTYGTYKPNTNSQGQRDQDLSWYNDAVGRLQNKGFERGSELWNKNAQRIHDIGNKWGLNWQQHLGKDYTPGQTASNTMNTISAPTGMRPENLPLFELLNNDERRQFINMRNSDPRAALDWMQKTTRGRQPAQTQQPVQAQQPVQPEQPVQAEQAPPAVEPAAPQPAQPSNSSFDFSSYQSPMTKALLDAMSQGFSTMQAYEPKYFEGSPLYQFQKQKGSADLEKLMAARGLTGSGAEIQANSDFLANLNATESEKQRQYAEANRDRQQRAMEFVANFDRQEREALRDQWNADLDRQSNISQFEAGRGDKRQELMVNFLSNVLGLQSQNDIARISNGGLNSQTELSKALMSMIGQNIMSQVPKATGGGGGTPPPPPTTNMSDLYKIMMNYGNNAGNNDFLNTIFRMFS